VEGSPPGVTICGGVLMRRAIQITVVMALIMLGPVGAVAEAVCWWSMGCFAGFERCQVELNRP